MDKRLILSPMGKGNGAYVIHRLLEHYIKDYKVIPYHANWTFIPFSLPFIANTRQAHIIHTVPDYARFFFRQSIPMIISFQNYVLDSWMRPYSSFLQKLHYATDLKLWTKLAINKAVKITAVSKFTANLVEKDMKLSGPIDVIYNGVDIDQFRPNRMKRLNQNEVRVFFSGNLTRRKGAQWLPEIARLLDKNINIFYTQGLRTRKKMPDLSNLHSIGLVPFEDMPNRYRQMDILLMPTVREGLSVAVMEAMASGLPVVASNCSSLPEQIDEGQGGFLCPIGEIKAFADKINILADSSKLRQDMGKYNRVKVENKFSIHQMVSAYQKVFNKALK